MIVTSLLIPLLFIQSVKVFEIIQMSWYYPFLASLVAAFGLSLIKQKVLIVLIIFLTLPSTYEIYTHYVTPPKTRGNVADFPEYQFLRSRGMYDNTVLELPSRTPDLTRDKLLIWFNHSSPHMAAYANKRSYASTMQIDFPNMDIEGRIAILQEVLRLASASASVPLGELLVKNNIKYLYTPDEYPGLESQKIKLVYRGSRYIYEVQ